MTDRGAWKDERYLQKKAQLQGQHNANEDIEGWLPSRHEIMPDCVLQIVRHLYPNPKGVPYMGHRFQ